MNLPRSRRIDLLDSIEHTHEIDVIPKGVFAAPPRITKEKLAEGEVEAKSVRPAMNGADTQGKWVDWYKAYGESVDGKSKLSDERKEDHRSGVA